ncbi:DUF2339 domain-containing protein [Candidatus Avelusimicrobium sp.]
MQWRLDKLEKELQEAKSTQTATDETHTAPTETQATSEPAPQPEAAQSPEVTSQPAVMAHAQPKQDPAAQALTPESAQNPVHNALRPEQTEPATALTPQASVIAVQEPTLQKEDAPKTASRQTTEGIAAGQVFSWVGGFTLFLAIVFWIKYSIDNNLLTPVMRIVLGSAVGIVLLVSGLLIRKEKIQTTANTLAGSGLAILYAVVFCGYTFYQLFSMQTAFGAMVVIALMSFAVALYKQTQYIGFLAVITSFLTPYLVAGQEPNMLFFLLYLALVNAAATATALKARWNGLLMAAFIFTGLGQLSVFGAISKTDTALAIGYGIFCALYGIAAAWICLKKQDIISTPCRAVLLSFIVFNLFLACTGLTSCAHFFNVSLVFLAVALCLNLLLCRMAHASDDFSHGFLMAGKIIIVLGLFLWTARLASGEFLALQLSAILAFAAINATYDILMYRKKKVFSTFAGIFPILLMLTAFIQSQSMTFGILMSFSALMIVLLGAAVVYALVCKKIVPAVVAAVLFTLFLLKAPTITLEYFFSSTQCLLMWILGVVPAVICAVAGACLRKRFDIPPHNGLVFTCTLLPYLLVVSVLANNQVQADTSVHLVFGFTLALNGLCALFTWIYKEARPMWGALAGTALLQLIYLFNGVGESAVPFMLWVGAIWLLFFLYPFFCGKDRIPGRSPWAVGSLSGVISVLICVDILKNDMEIVYTTALPFFMAAIYALAIYYVYKWEPITQERQKQRILWLSAAALSFITLIFPLEMNKAWLTCAWALEGLALVYLNKFLPHKGLRIAALGLLSIAFIRLVLNPAIFSYYETTSSLFNWYLYAFLLVGSCLLTSASLWTSSSENKAPVYYLQTLGGIVLFVLMNIEITNYFATEEGLKFHFFGDFAPAITYTLGWTIFGAICIFLGLNRKGSIISKVGIVLVSFSLMKLFLSDIWTLGGLYRIAGLFGIAMVLIAISFAYQYIHKKE